MIGTWPAEDLDAPVPREASEEYAERLRAYMRKAIKGVLRRNMVVSDSFPGFGREARGAPEPVDPNAQ